MLIFWNSLMVKRYDLYHICLTNSIHFWKSIEISVYVLCLLQTRYMLMQYDVCIQNNLIAHWHCLDHWIHISKARSIYFILFLPLCSHLILRLLSPSFGNLTLPKWLKQNTQRNHSRFSHLYIYTFWLDSLSVELHTKVEKNVILIIIIHQKYIQWMRLPNILISKLMLRFIAHQLI